MRIFKEGRLKSNQLLLAVSASKSDRAARLIRQQIRRREFLRVQFQRASSVKECICFG